jgi:16S rRNA (cytosine1402-N4)-methyltransferase
MQFDEDFRGFSFQKEGALDMRMDTTTDITAKDVVNGLSEDELGGIFRDLGEERFWRRGARAIVDARRKKEITTTKELADVIEKEIPRSHSLHPATKIFQAIRIYINKELESIEGSLKKAIEVLAPGGKIGVLSFHSLEDRIVKNIFRDASKSIKGVDVKPILTLLTKKPRIPTPGERRINRRSRSAKLRFAEKL